MVRKSVDLPGSEQRLFAEPAIAKMERADGSIILRSTVELQDYARCVGDWLEHWARQTPQRIFLAERAITDAQWTTLTYMDALQQVRSAAAWMLAQDMSAERPLMVLSDRSHSQPLAAIVLQYQQPVEQSE
jgi:feruloyl-CoA synthase